MVFETLGSPENNLPLFELRHPDLNEVLAGEVNHVGEFQFFLDKNGNKLRQTKVPEHVRDVFVVRGGGGRRGEVLDVLHHDGRTARAQHGHQGRLSLVRFESEEVVLVPMIQHVTKSVYQVHLPTHTFIEHQHGLHSVGDLLDLGPPNRPHSDELIEVLDDPVAQQLSYFSLEFHLQSAAVSVIVLN